MRITERLRASARDKRNFLTTGLSAAPLAFGLPLAALAYSRDHCVCFEVCVVVVVLYHKRQIGSELTTFNCEMEKMALRASINMWPHHLPSYDFRDRR